MKEKQFIFENVNLHYKTTGIGFPVVLIHGFAEDSSIWDNQVEYLKNDYHLIIPDLPGSGKSGLIDKDNFGIDDYALCIKEILSAERVERYVMIGHSMGGYISLAFAEKFSESLIAFGLFHSSAYADDEAKKDMRKKAIDFIETNGSEAFLKTSIPGLFYDQGNSGTVDAFIEGNSYSGQATIVARPLYGEKPDRQKVARRVVARRVDELIKKGKSFSPKALIQYYKAMIARPDRTKVLMNASVPVLFIMGEHDKAVPFKHSLEQSHLPHQSYINILRNSAHMGMLEEPEKVNQILANFLLNQFSNIQARQLF